MSERIAIIGGGIAGLTAGYLLKDKYEITLFEREDRLGGNAYTLTTRDGHVIDVSVFFFNANTYPNFFKLLGRLGVNYSTHPLAGASMTLQNLDTRATRYFNFDPLERWSLRRLSPRSAAVALSLAANIVRSLRLLEDGKFDGLTMEEALRLLPKLQGEASKLLLFPLCLMASMHYHELMKAPARHFMGKVEHHFGGIGKVMGWRLLNCRTDDYIEALAKGFRGRIALNSKINSVARDGSGVTLRLGDGEARFERVVFACYADQALKLLERPTEDERRILGSWRYNDGLVVVHRDAALFPRKELLSMYEYLYTDRDGKIETSINADYGYQKGVADDCGLLGTQYPNFPIREELVEFKKVFRTPIYDPVSMPTIRELPKLNGVDRTYYCGSHFGYGLHEDAVTSAVEAGRMLGVEW